MALNRLTKITGPGIKTDTNWVGNNANFTGVTTTSSSFNVGVTTIHSTLAEVHNVKSTGIVTATGFVGGLTGDVTGNVTGNVSGTSGSTTGNAATATKLATARTIGGVSFDGSANINLPGVNSAGNQNTSGNAATSTLAVNAQGLTGSPNITVTNITADNVSIAQTLTYEDVKNIDSIGIITARTGIKVLTGGANVVGVVTATSFVGDGSNLTGLAADKIFEGNTKAEVSDTGSNGRFFVETEGAERFSLSNSGNFTFNTASDNVINADGNLTIDFKTSNSIRHRAIFKSSETRILPIGNTDGLVYGMSGDATKDIRFVKGGEFKLGVGVTVHSTTSNAVFAGIVTASSFSGSAANLTNIPAANITGTLPAISGANLTNLDASDLASGTIPDARFPATLPAVSGANLTSVNADTVDGIQAASFVRSDATDTLTGEITLSNNLIKFSGTSNDRTVMHFIKSGEIKWRLLQNSFNAGGGDNLNFDRVNGTGIFMVDGYRVLTTSDINAQASGAVHSGISTFQDIDVDGHTNLDNVSIAGVVTATSFAKADGSAVGEFTTDDNNNLIAGVGAGSSIGSEEEHNIFLGFNAGAKIDHNTSYSQTGKYNVIIGSNAAFNDVLPRFNTIIGYESKKNGNGGYEVTAVGKEALRDCTGNFNTALGAQAGRNNTSAEHSVFVGYQAGVNGNGDDTIAIGSQTLGSLTSGDDNIAIGRQSGWNISSGHGNVCLGRETGGSSGSYNICIGTRASHTGNPSNECLIGGNPNQNWRIDHLRVPGIGVSFSTGGGVVTGIMTASSFKLLDGSTVGGVSSDSEENTIGGTGAGDNLDSDTYRNTLFGYQAGEQINSGDDNTLVGWKAADKLTSGYKNCAFGSEALEFLTSGYDNVAMGWEAGRSCNGNGNTMIGNMAGRSMSGNDNIAIGDHAYSNGGGTRSIGLGGESVWLGGTDVIGIGQYTMAKGGSQIGGIGIGRYAGRNNAGDYNVYLGYEAGYGTGSSPYAIGNYNISLGYRSLYSVSTAYDNVAIGASSGRLIDTGYENVLMGKNAGEDISSGKYMVCLGSEAGTNMTTAWKNIAIGWKAGHSVQAGDSNVLIGAEAGDSIVNSNDNIAIGRDALGRATNGADNTVIGANANNNSVNGTTSGSNNTVIGHDANPSSNSVSNEVTIGDSNITKFRVPGINVTLKDNGGTPTQGHVLTVDGNGEAGFAAAPTTTISNNTSNYFLTATGSSTNIDGKSGLRAHGNAYFWSTNDNGGISMGSAGGGSFGTSPTIARAGQNGYHMSNSSQGDMCLGGEFQKSIRFGTTNNSSGQLATRLIIQADGHIIPGANSSQDLGSSSVRWNNIYSADLQLSNESKKDTGGNDVDGTWGDWTLQEGENDIFMINNRTGKKFAITMREVS